MANLVASGNLGIRTEHLDPHPKKTLLDFNVKPKIFKTYKRRKTLNKSTNKTPLENQASSTTIWMDCFHAKPNKSTNKTPRENQVSSTTTLINYVYADLPYKSTKKTPLEDQASSTINCMDCFLPKPNKSTNKTPLDDEDPKYEDIWYQHDMSMMLYTDSPKKEPEELIDPFTLTDSELDEFLGSRISKEWDLKVPPTPSASPSPIRYDSDSTPSFY